MSLCQCRWENSRQAGGPLLPRCWPDLTFTRQSPSNFSGAPKSPLIGVHTHAGQTKGSTQDRHRACLHHIYWIAYCSAPEGVAFCAEWYRLDQYWVSGASVQMDNNHVSKRFLSNDLAQFLYSFFSYCYCFAIWCRSTNRFPFWVLVLLKLTTEPRLLPRILISV